MSANNTYLSDREIAARYGIHRVTPWNWAKQGKFPKPVKLTSGCTRWRLADVEAWEKEREAA